MKKALVSVVLVVSLVVGFFAWPSIASMLAPDIVDLPKAEALALKDAHLKFILAKADFEEVVKQSCLQHGLPPTAILGPNATHQLDLSLGQIVPIKAPQ